MEIVVVESAVELVDHFDDAQDPPSGNERYTEDRAGLKTGLPVELGCKLPGITGIGNDDGFAAGGGIAGDPLSERDAEGIENADIDLGIAIESDFESQFALFDQEKRSRFDVHDRPDHVHRVFEDLLPVEG